MKKLSLIAALVLVASSFGAFADSYPVTSAILTTNTQFALSDQIAISGPIERIELYNTGSATCAVTIATYGGTNSTNSILQTVCSVALTVPKVIRPRVVGTGTSGTALTYTVVDSGIGATGLVAQALSVPYEQIMGGGNLKMSVVSTATPATSNQVMCTIFYTPTRH